MRFAPSLVAAALIGLAGCGPSGPKTYPVNGKVVLTGADVATLAGHHVEAALESNPTVRASGIIGPDGGFSLETLHAGVILKGALEGKYRVRLIRADEDDDGKKLRRPPVADHHLKFETSGLSFEVPPPSGDVTLELRSR